MMWAEPAESLGGVYYKIIEPKIHPIRTKWREKSALVFFQNLKKLKTCAGKKGQVGNIGDMFPE